MFAETCQQSRPDSFLQVVQCSATDSKEACLKNRSIVSHCSSAALRHAIIQKRKPNSRLSTSRTKDCSRGATQQWKASCGRLHICPTFVSLFVFFELAPDASHGEVYDVHVTRSGNPCCLVSSVHMIGWHSARVAIPVTSPGRPPAWHC